MKTQRNVMILLFVATLATAQQPTTQSDRVARMEQIIKANHRLPC